jgi:hypothetical protein
MVVMNILISGPLKLSALSTLCRLIASSNAFSLILFRWLTRGWFLLRNYPLSTDLINTRRRWGRLTNRRTPRCEKRRILPWEKAKFKIYTFTTYERTQKKKLIILKTSSSFWEFFSYKKKYDVNTGCFCLSVPSMLNSQKCKIFLVKEKKCCETKKRGRNLEITVKVNLLCLKRKTWNHLSFIWRAELEGKR